QLDRLVAVRRDVDQVVAVEAMLVKEVRRDAEAVHGTTMPNAQCPMPKGQRALRLQFVQVLRQQFPQAAESGVPIHGSARVGERARDVLDVNGVRPRGGLETKRAERLEVTLQRHQIESPREFAGV